MKILQVGKLYYPWVGGVEKVMELIAEGLNGKQGFAIKVLCCQSQGRGKREEIRGVEVTRASSWTMLLGMPVSFSFLRLFRKMSQKTDIISLHQPFPVGDLAFFLARPKADLVVHYHADIVRKKFFHFLAKPFIRHSLKKARKIIVSSPPLIKNSACLKDFQEKCVMIPFGINVEEFRPAYQTRKVQEIQENYGKSIVLFVGRHVYYKGLIYLIETMKDIPASLVLIGDGPQKEKLKAKARQLSLTKKVFFLSALTGQELIAFFQSAAVFVLPSISRSESFSLTIIEAMACQKPIISTELGTGTSYNNQNGVTGFVVRPKNIPALKSAIKKIIEDKQLAQNMGARARQRVISEFSLEEMLTSISNLYRNLNV